MQASLIVTGNEILLGGAVDTNGAFIGRRLHQSGIEPVLKISVPDTEKEIAGAIGKAFRKTSLILVTGGLGPTRDDVTREAVAGFTGKRLVFRRELLKNIKAFFNKRGMEMPPISSRQAFLPAGAAAVRNRFGTAPGFILRHKGRIIVVLPGPPREMKPMLESLVPFFRSIAGRKYAYRVLKTYGIGESAIEETLADIKNSRDLEIGFQAHPGQVDIKITARAANAGLADKKVDEVKRLISGRLGRNIMGSGDISFEGIAGSLLKRKRKTLAVAESCTGGLVSNLITNVPGSSDYFQGGVVSYSNEMKMKILGVPQPILKKFGAVSGQAAGKMAEGIRRVAGTDYGLGITGIAGPSGATRNKPAGLVYIALASAGRLNAEKHNFYGERAEVKERTARAALLMLINHLKNL